MQGRTVLSGSKYLLEAFVSLLVEAGYDRYTTREYDEAEGRVYLVADEDRDYWYDTEESPDFCLPEDWDRAVAAILHRDETVEVNGVTVKLNKGSDKNIVFYIVDPSNDVDRAVTKQQFDALRELFDADESKLELGSWTVTATEVQIGCTTGFTSDHLDEIIEFLDDNDVEY